MLHLLLLYLQLGLHLNTAMSSFHIFSQRCFTGMNYKFHTLWKGFICARHISGPIFSGHCYKPIIWAQALRNLCFVSLPEDGARKLRVDAAVWESHLVLLLMHKPCSFSRATLRWCRWLKVGRGDAVGYKGLLEGDWFSLFCCTALCSLSEGIKRHEFYLQSCGWFCPN